jgi:DNA-binding LacI/PurR family transcriptional regulator
MRVRVPEDISLIGFDDLSLGSLLHPPLTCIERPDVEQGALAMRLLLSRLAGRQTDEPRRVVLETRLLIRGSTCSPAAVASSAAPQRRKAE